MQYIINPSGERISVILPIAEYEALLRCASEDETGRQIKLSWSLGLMVIVI
jgi:hypothetical protein